MTIAYACVLVAALLPYVWTVVAKSAAPGYNNRNPRAWIAKHGDNYRMQRANAAHLNAFEAFAPFAAGVVMAQLAGVDPGRIALLSVAFVALRVLHGVFYVADKQNLRSLSWFAAFACVIALLVMAVLNVGT